MYTGKVYWQKCHRYPDMVLSSLLALAIGITSICVMSPKLGKSNIVVSVTCHSLQRFCHKSLPMEIWLNENMGQKQFCKGMEQRTLKNVHNCLNTNIYSYLETCGGQSSNPYLNVVYFFSTRKD